MTADEHPMMPEAQPVTRSLPLPDEAATLALGAAIAGLLRRGDLLTLSGDLGAGKTTLSRGVLRGLGHAGPVPSPNFTLVQHYETERLALAHFDLYRLAARDEIFELGFDDALHEGVVLVEGPEVLGEGRPADRLAVRLEDSGTGRLAQMTGFGDWAARLRALAV